MIPRHVAIFLTAGLLLVGCSKRPQFSYDIQEDVSVERYRDIALDPRTDVLFVDEGKHPVDATAFKAQVLRELQSMGYRLVPAEQAKLWLDVFAMREGASRGGPSPSGMGGGHRGGGPGGGGPGGGGQGGRQGRSGGMQTGAMPEGRPSGGAVTLVVAFIEPTDAHVRWRGVLELQPQERPHHQPGQGPGSPNPMDDVQRLLGPLRPGGFQPPAQ